jgi:hypothetical protein
VVLHCGLPERQRIRAQPVFQRMSAERAEHHRGGAEQRADRQERLQAGFLSFFFGLCGRFLP